MPNYRMRVYRPARPEPRLWQTYNIVAADDQEAMLLAGKRYKELADELTRSGDLKSRLRLAALQFSLTQGDRLVYQSVHKDAR